MRAGDNLAGRKHYVPTCNVTASSLLPAAAVSSRRRTGERLPPTRRQSDTSTVNHTTNTYKTPTHLRLRLRRRLRLPLRLRRSDAGAASVAFASSSPFADGAGDSARSSRLRGDGEREREREREDIVTLGNRQTRSAERQSVVVWGW